MPPQPFPAAHPFLFLAILFGAMFVSSYLVAALSGWRELARVYPSEGTPPDARSWRGKSARMRGGTRYNHALTIAANHQGIELRVFFILRPGHPPIFIPWGDIQTHPEKGWLIDYIRFTFRHTAVWLALPRPFADEVLRLRPRT